MRFIFHIFFICLVVMDTIMKRYKQLNIFPAKDIRGMMLRQIMDGLM